MTSREERVMLVGRGGVDTASVVVAAANAAASATNLLSSESRLFPFTRVVSL